MECKFNIGDKVVVVDAKPTYIHQYKNGDVGIVSQIDHINHGYVTREDGARMNVYWDELEIYKEQPEESTMEQTAERIREEYLHIEKRIEEAKKDIACMEQEKDVLIEKLREKGFELTYRAPTNSRSQKLTVGDIVRITSYNREYHDCNCIDQTAEVLKVDNSTRPYYVRTESYGFFWCTPEEVEKI